MTPDEVAASWVSYGSGWPGTNGEPILTPDALPTLGKTINLLITNCRGAKTRGILLLGFDEAQIPTLKGGDFLVDIYCIHPFGFADDQTRQIPLRLPCLAGLSVYFQALVFDPGAAEDVAGTKGLRPDLGLSSGDSDFGQGSGAGTPAAGDESARLGWRSRSLFYSSSSSPRPGRF